MVGGSNPSRGTNLRSLALLVIAASILLSTSVQGPVDVRAKDSGATPRAFVLGTRTASVALAGKLYSAAFDALAVPTNDDLRSHVGAWLAPSVAVGFDHGLVPVRQPLDFVFDRPVLASGVESTVEITPPIEGQISWPDRRTLRFQPRYLAFGTSYKVHLSMHSRLERWNELQVDWALDTEPAPVPGTGYPYILTFDDCGTSEQVNRILDALSARGMQAIFFPTGICRDQNPWLIPTLLARGHLACNHTYSHPQLHRLSNAAIAQQIRDGVHTGCMLFRPPYGDWDGPNGRVARIAASQGFQVMMWDVDTRDWSGTSAASMVTMIHAGGRVVLLHMHGRYTVEAILAL